MIDIDETTRVKLRALRLSTFADIYFALLNDDANADELPENIFLAAVDEALEQRRQRNVAKAIAQAHLFYPHATIADISRPSERGINERQLKRLAATKWREEPTNIHILAPTGAGKPTSPAHSASKPATPGTASHTSGSTNSPRSSQSSQPHTPTTPP